MLRETLLRLILQPMTQASIQPRQADRNRFGHRPDPDERRCRRMRLTPLPSDRWDDQARDALASAVSAERISGIGVGNLMATLVRHPMLTRAYLPFGFYLQRDSTLPPRLREMVILRVAHRAACEYEWAHHVTLAYQVGLSDADIAAAIADYGDDGVAAPALRAVDELLTGFRLSHD